MDPEATFLRRLKENKQPYEVRFFVRPGLLRSSIKGSVNKFSKLHFMNRGSLYQMLCGKRAVPLKLLEKLGINPSGFMCIVSNSNVAIRLPNELTSDLGYLVGALRDGTVAREGANEYLCAYYGKSRDYVRNLQKLVHNVFGLNVKMEKFPEVYGIRIRSLTLYLFMRLTFEVPRYQRDWVVPSLIAAGSEEVKRAYISGFWDAEGICPRMKSLVKNVRKNLYTGFVQKNKGALEFIKRELAEQNIRSGKIYWNNRVWVLKVSSSSLYAFGKYIKSRHPSKKRRLGILCNVSAVQTACSQG